MNKISLLTVVVLFAATGLQAQEKNKTITDPKRNKEVLIDEVSREAFLTPVFGEYYQQDYDIYRPDETVLKQLSPKTRDVAITIVLASWCGDSREQLPRFMKILDQIGFDFGKLHMIAVDSYKTGREVDVAPFNIERVPTFIFFRNGREIGRIIETPRQTLEADMFDMLSRVE